MRSVTVTRRPPNMAAKRLYAFATRCRRGRNLPLRKIAKPTGIARHGYTYIRPGLKSDYFSAVT